MNEKNIFEKSFVKFTNTPKINSISKYLCIWENFHKNIFRIINRKRYIFELKTGIILHLEFYAIKFYFVIFREKNIIPLKIQS